MNKTLPEFKPSLCTIPQDVLCELFEMGKRCQNERFAIECDQEEMPFELLVTQICSYTRRVALSTPRLWTSIYISSSSVRERIVAYIARSAFAWLDIRIDMMQLLSSTSEKNMDTLLDLIFPESYRWRRLSILRLFEHQGHAVVARICDCQAPSLRDLSLMVENTHHENANAVSDLKSSSIFKSTTQLQFVRLSGLALHLFRPRLDAVVILHLDETKGIPFAYSKFREILLSSSSLEHLSIYGDIIPSVSWPHSQYDIHLPNLRSLRICGVSGEAYSNMLLSLDIPRLESLTLKRLHEHDLDALLERVDVTKFSNLKCLKFWDFDLSVHTYERMMRIFQSVTSFCTMHSAIPESHLVELLLDESKLFTAEEDPLWPTLKVLSFPLNSDEGEEDVELAQALITSRKLRGCPISKVLFYASAEIDQETVIESDLQGIRIVYSSRQDTWPSKFVDQDDIFLQ